MPWFRKLRFQIAIALLAFVGLPVAGLIPVSNYCSAPIENSWQQEHPESSDVVEDHSSTQEGASDQSSPIIKFLKSLNKAQEAHYKAEYAEKPKQNWWHTFICDLKITDFLIATFTYWLALVTGGLIWIARRQEESTRTIERAYLKIFPHEPPRFRLDRAIGKIEADVEVRNVGKTPAEITHYWILAIFVRGAGKMPTPDEGLGSHNPGRALLMSGDHMVAAFSVIDAKNISNITEVENGTQTLYLVGYVDYIDKFRVRHRCGFARFYNPSRPVKFWYVTEEGHNYDRERKKEKGEGNDWDDAPTS